MKHIFFSILTTLALLACNSQEKAKNQTIFCYVRYDEAQKAVIAEASLQNANSKTSLEIPGGVRYQGMEMKLSPVYGLTYRYEYAADFLSEHTFEWRDESNNKQLFRMPMDSLKTFSVGDGPVSQTKPCSLVWEGSPLGKGETMVLMWENTAKGLTVPMEVSSTSGQPIIDIPAAKLSDIVPGDWTLSLVRKKLTKSTVGEMPVNGISEVYSNAIPVKVTK